MNFKRLTPQQLVLGIGIGVALITVLSGIAAEVFAFKNENEVHRTVFANIPDVIRLVFYTVIPILIVYGAWMFSLRVKNWRRGGPDNRATTKENVGRRLADFRSGVYMRTLMREPGAGLMHSMMYFSFVILLGVTTVLGVSVWKILSPVSVWKTLSPVSVWKTLSAVSVWKILSPVSVWKTLSPVSVWKILSPVSVWKILSPVSVWKTLSPVSV